MMNSKQLLTQPLKVPNSSVIFMLVIAVIGFADATYLAVEHFLNRVPPCSITAGCEQVLTSPYATVLGIPVSLLGSLFYLLIAVFLFIYLDFKNPKALKCALVGTVFGIIASLWFIYLQIFVIHSYCAYCLGSAITSAILFICAFRIFELYRQPTNNESTLNPQN